MCEPGEPVHLVPKPTNEHDPAAVAVFSARGIQIGSVE
ncbi:HIRAN domain-containing protein [Sphingomonas panaciterrae]